MLGELIVVGPVTDLEERSGISAKTGEPWRMVTAFIASKRSVYRVLLDDSIANDVSIGDDVALSVYIEVYQNRANLRATGWADSEKLAGQAAARAA